MARIALVNPRFEVSYWGLEHALPLLGKKANLPTHCLPLLAALTPPPHQVTLLDENVQSLDLDFLASHDIVGLTGMNVQRRRMREILEQLRRRGTFTVVGGPWVTVQEDYFADLPDVVFIGEADETWPQFLQDWERGEHATRYEQSSPTDMSRLPTPRFDLMRMHDYMFGSLQFTRGCPFQCEFCDIIVIFGRRPRLKTSVQILAELDAFHRQGLETAFVVDDNLIGNKAELKPRLRDIADWQRARGYPLSFFTEASLDLADDPELLQLMVDANFVSVFIGVETPNEESLRETRKHQNLRQGGMLSKIHRVQDSGLDVWCGMIVGFDNDDATIFGRQQEFVEQARIAQVMLGLLHAVPKTPLHQRLAAEGRLDEEDSPAFGTNVIPAKMSRRELRDGYVRLFRALYEPAAYFDRLDALYLDGGFRFGMTRSAYLRRRPLRWLAAKAADLARFAFIAGQVLHQAPRADLRREYARRLWGCLRRRPDPQVLFVYALKCAVHHHLHRMSQDNAGETAPLTSTFL